MFIRALLISSLWFVINLLTYFIGPFAYIHVLFTIDQIICNFFHSQFVPFLNDYCYVPTNTLTPCTDAWGSYTDKHKIKTKIVDLHSNTVPFMNYISNRTRIAFISVITFRKKNVYFMSNSIFNFFVYSDLKRNYIFSVKNLNFSAENRNKKKDIEISFSIIQKKVAVWLSVANWAGFFFFCTEKTWIAQVSNSKVYNII